MTLPSNFLFLKSVRFWKLFIVAVLLALEQQGIIQGGLSEAMARILELTLGGSVLIRTVDRLGEGIPKQ